MFQTPKISTFLAPAEPIDPTQRYLVKLVELSDEGVSKFAEDPTAPDAPHNIKWIFELATADTRAPIRDIDGGLYRLWQYTSNKTGKAKGKVARAREWMEAFLGRPLEDNEIDDTMPARITGKVALALFEEQEVESSTGEMFTRLKILKLAPYKPGAAKAAPKPAPAPEPEPVAAGW